MFGFLKEKLKAAAQKFSSQIKEVIKPSEEAEEAKPVEKPAEKKEEKKVEEKKKEEKKPEPKKEAKVEKKKEEPKKEEKKTEPKPEPKKEEPKVELEPEVKAEKKGFFQSLKDKFTREKPVEEAKPEVRAEEAKPEPKPEPKVEEKVEELKEEAEEEAPEEVPEEVAEEQPEEEAKSEVEEKPAEKKGFFAKLGEKFTTTKISEDKFNDLFWDMEVALLESNVAVEVIEKIKDDLKKNLVDTPIGRSGIDELILKSLKQSIEQLFVTEDLDIIEMAKKKQPLVIAVFGVNGAGKTTTIAKLVRLFEKNGITSVLAAADTFRTAAIEQLEEHANKLGVKMIKHDYGSDSAAVAFDAIKHAQSKGRAVVIIDTAGRTHVNQNLMDELKKLVRVSKPDLKIFVGDALTGNDAVEQARAFNEAVGIDGIILTKVDVDEKGGSSVSISYVTKKPILYIGTGQGYDDLQKFSPSIVLQNLQLD